ncbi:hypothetical protein PanWU01x14_207450 [Parasponia andersonii]|uniref:Uncharacterized protein n=1 Tax=Parasponia andersonii TaxID=3476 RepID=A0A2P5BV18_PARAD|nr:hypothetical protein PanWU01x14_207450 [Parasponia andersonii]
MKQRRRKKKKKQRNETEKRKLLKKKKSSLATEEKLIESYTTSVRESSMAVAVFVVVVNVDLDQRSRRSFGVAESTEYSPGECRRSRRHEMVSSGRDSAAPPQGSPGNRKWRGGSAPAPGSSDAAAGMTGHFRGN